jgi:glyoxylase-like metal-dependent hydrolase (beta-lactamase superfamily II)
MKLQADNDFGEWITVAGNMFYPAYIIKGKERHLMIDAGINLMGPAYIASLGKIFGDKNALDYVFATHSHFDHMGAIPYLKRSSKGGFPEYRRERGCPYRAGGF